MTAEAIVQEIRRCEDARYKAMLDGDQAALDRLLDPGLVYTHSSGVADSKESYMAGIRDKVWAYRDLARTDETITVHGDAALVFNRLQIKIDVRGVRKELDNRALAVWSKAGGDWRMVALHSTPIPRV